MNKNPIAILSTDWHLKESNIESIKDLITQKCKLAVDLGVDHLFCLGDIFNSRKAQTQNILNSFTDILDIIHGFNMCLWCIPGNHDKTNYGDAKSFLEPFKHHPALELTDLSAGLPFGREISVEMIPYFSDERWLEEFNFLNSLNEDTNCKRILLSHQAFTGSRNNDGSEVLSKISTTMFSKFELVLFGHYHDQQQIASNCYHIPSIQQNNYGENSEKGFTVLYDDCSFELVKSNFKEYKKVVIDMDTTSKKELDVITKEYANSTDNIRFELIGTENVLKSLNKEVFTSNGIDVKTKVKEIEDTIQYSEEEIKEYTTESILEEFKLFCEEKGKNYEQGIKYLQEKLKK